MKVMFEPKEGTDQPIDGIDVLSHAEIDDVVNYMRMGMHDRVAAKKRRAMVTSPHWWDDKMLVTGKYEKDEFLARVMDHIADQYDGPVGSDPPTWGFPRVGTGSDEHQPEAANFRRLLKRYGVLHPYPLHSLWRSSPGQIRNFPVDATAS